MFINTIFFISCFYLVLISVLGYGLIFSKIFDINSSKQSIGIVGLLGVFLLTFISYFTNFIFAHDFIHNLLVLFLGFIFIFYSFYKDNSFKKETFKILLITLFYIIGLFLSKNNEDFSYYHLMSVANLTENKIQFGLANYNSGFGTQSSIFYFISLLYFPVIKYYLFNAHSLLILIFSSVIFLDNFFFKKEEKNNFINILSLFLFTFVNIIFSNLSGYGSDRAGQIVVFIIFIIFFDILFKKSILVDNVKVFLVLIFYVVTIKSYFFIYILLLLLMYLEIKKYYSYNILLKNFYFLFFLSSYLLLYFSVNLANTGCIIFPLRITCFSNLFWSVSLDGVSSLNHWFELWSKAGATPNYIVENKIEYVQNFNWVSNWINNYFIGKGTDTLAAIIAIVVIFILIFSFNKNKIKKQKFSKTFFYLYCFLILFLFVWFNKHPDLRYGGYAIFVLIFFIPASIYLYKFNNFSKKNNILIFFIVLIIISTFNIRNYVRIVSEFKRNDSYKFTNFPFFSSKYLEILTSSRFTDKRIVIKGYNFYLPN